ncbi:MULTISPECIES: DUF6538 domain-containing protein [unclassified Methylophaga]|uniref:DUF6538 domain-containing protein n=1 Tax=unclassified Methylophaga TaxID=2629249 RepID=UPI000C8D9A18|nr:MULTISPECIES: DUF6538 domain-containing protein [unclassified Methylophaga]MBN46064.1 hypothetical protein [Methylophaga sp.]
MSYPEYLFLRHQTWFVKKKVPKELQQILNKKVIVMTTGTRDLKLAISKRNIILGEIEREFEQIRNPSDKRLESFRGTARWLREEQRKVWQQELTPEELADIALDSLYYRLHPDANGYGVPHEHQEEIANLHKLAIDPDANNIGDTINQYLDQKNGTIQESTFHEKKRHLEHFAGWIGRHTLIAEISAKDAGNYLTVHLMRQTTKLDTPVSSGTLKKHLNIFKAFFSWAESMGLVDKNPFNKTADRLPKKTTGGSEIKVRAWNESEVIKLLEKIKSKNDNKLASITLLAMFTGARSEELAQLKTDDVTSWSLKIRSETKNENSQRNVPIHSLIKPLVEKLAATSKDGYLISGLKTGGQDNKRFHYIGKAFSDMKQKMGFPNRTKVFHSFRHTLVTRLRNAGETPDRIGGAIGHIEDLNFTVHTYADELESSEAIKVIEKLDYRTEVNELVSELIEKIKN